MDRRRHAADQGDDEGVMSQKVRTVGPFEVRIGGIGSICGDRRGVDSKSHRPVYVQLSARYPRFPRNGAALAVFAQCVFDSFHPASLVVQAHNRLPGQPMNLSPRRPGKRFTKPRTTSSFDCVRTSCRNSRGSSTRVASAPTGSCRSCPRRVNTRILRLHTTQTRRSYGPPPPDFYSSSIPTTTMSGP